jgi:hypothetical protein
LHISPHGWQTVHRLSVAGFFGLSQSLSYFFHMARIA